MTTHLPRKLGHIKRVLRKGAVHTRSVRIATLVATAGVLLASNILPVAAAQAPTPPANQEQIAASLQEVQSSLDRTADDKLGGDKQRLKRTLDETTNDVQPGWGWLPGRNKKPCHPIEKLTDLLERLQRLRTRLPSDELEAFYLQVWTLRQDLIQSLPAGVKCEGVEPTTTEPTAKLRTSDNKQVSFEVGFAAPALTAAKGNNKTFSRVHVQGIENMVGTPGQPAVPMYRKLIAIPEGSKPVIKKAEIQKGDSLRLNLVPFQEQAVDQAAPGQGEGQDPGNPREGIPPEPAQKVFADQPFALDQKTYDTNRFLPANPCKITPMGQYRDVQMAQLECGTGQYNPVTDIYIPHRSLNVEVAFEGGAGNFATKRTLSQFENNTAAIEPALNREAISKYVRDIDLSGLQCSGEEFLILTHPNFRAAADRLADHKRARGMVTNVFNVGTGTTRNTADEIDDFIEDRYDDCKIRPSYVMLMGDAEFIPTFYPAGMADNAGSDFPYSNYVQILFDAFFPDFGTGRVPVDTLAQANTVVDKIVKYEADPPFEGFGNGGPFYTTAGFASQFQCCRMNANGTPLNSQPGTDQRAFIETSEFVRQELVDRGYTVPRIYTRTVDDGGYCIQENANGDCIQTQAAYSGNTTPRRYFNGSLLPAALGAGSGFAWNGSTANITSAWNEGRFLFLHRDHGWPGGWGSPGFSTTNVDNLSNGDLLPVVWSVNCASGMFDNETAGGTYDTTNGGVYFAERALRKADGGAIGVIGDSRNSPTWANNALTRGFFDSVWPNTVPGHGGNASYKRLGDILNWGKIYLAGQVGVDQTAGSISTDQMGYEYHIWQVIGDPTLAMWTKNPYRLVLERNFAIESVSRLSETVSYKQDGAVITKLEVQANGETKAIARGTVKNGLAQLPYVEQHNPDARVIYSASKADSASVTLNQPTTDPID